MFVLQTSPVGLLLLFINRIGLSRSCNRRTCIVTLLSVYVSVGPLYQIVILSA